MHHYCTADWRAFRAKVIDLDGGICLTCGRNKANGAVLQVHHKQYLPGHKPWEYPFELCETMCSGCHAALHGHVPPRFGWEHAGWDDLGDLTGTCECCGTSIRYVFMLQHPKWYAMEVGEICCDNLTSTQLELVPKKWTLKNEFFNLFFRTIQWPKAAKGNTRRRLLLPP
jgi:hypothetical protein